MINPFFQTKGKDQFRVQTKGKNLTVRSTVNDEGKRVSKPSSCFTTLQALYDMNQILLVTSQRRDDEGSFFAGDAKIKIFKQFRPSDKYLDKIYAELVRCWEGIQEAIPDLKKEPETMRDHTMPGQRSLVVLANWTGGARYDGAVLARFGIFRTKSRERTGGQKGVVVFREGQLASPFPALVPSLPRVG